MWLVASCSSPLPPQEILIRVETDTKSPVKDATLMHGGKLVGRTDATGTSKLTLAGREGEKFEIRVECPRGLRSPSKPLTIVLKRPPPGTIPEHVVICARP